MRQPADITRITMNLSHRSVCARRIGALSLCLLLVVPLVPAATARESEAPVETLRKTSQAFAAVSRQALPAVVFIRVEKTFQIGGDDGSLPPLNDPFSFFGDEFLQRFFGDRTPHFYRMPRQFRQTGQGSGFLITKDGYILTNNHIVGDADKISVQLHDGRRFQARRVGSDPKSEVAVIKIEGQDFPCLELGDSDKLEIGEWVIAVGNPFGLSETLTVGVVSAKGRSNLGIADYEDFIQTDAAINPGNSGGPLLNIDGQVIGINTAIYSQTGGSMGIGFAIPINIARTVKDQIVRTGKVTRGQIGIVIQPLTPDLAEALGLDSAEGILIADVVKGSPADKAGLKRRDVMLKLNNKPAESVAAFRGEIAMTPPGTAVTLTIRREGKVRDVSVKIGELSGEIASPGETPAAEPAGLTTQLGFSVSPLTDDLARRFGYEGDKGVLISRVEEGSPAAGAGLQPGSLITSVNHKDVASMDEFTAALAGSQKTKTVLLLVKERQYSRFVVLSLD